MLLSITNTASPAADLGYILHKNPANLFTADVSSGRAMVFYTEASEERCTACLLLEIDPVELVRGARRAEEYVNDRPYTASSYLAATMSRVFGTAMAGNCAQRPELPARALPLEIGVPVIRSRGGPEMAARLFEPLGYTVSVERHPLDAAFPEWGESSYYRLGLRARATVRDVLTHLSVLLPVLDDEKHYFVGAEEVEKLTRRGEGWLASHPMRHTIVSRYLKRQSTLVDQAFEQLLGSETSEVEQAEAVAEKAAHVERELERPMTLHTHRLHIVATRLRELGVKSVADLGCGEGKLLRRLLADRHFERILGIDVSHRALEIAAERLRLDRLPERQRARIEIAQGSLLYRDRRLAGFDAATLVEVIEHLDPARLAALERVVFEFARPRHVAVTTPNREYNALFANLPQGKFRHGDHRFDWTRAEVAEWTRGIEKRFGYRARVESIGPVDEAHGAPSQMAVFSLPEEAR